MYAHRMSTLPSYLFAKLDQLKSEKIKQGVKVIDLGIGDPDQPTPEHIIWSLCAAVEDPNTHKYPSYEGMISFREAVSQWYGKTFGVRLDPEDQVLALIGSKEGLAHIPLAFVNPGDVTLVPDPAYPVYRMGTLIAGGTPYPMPLLAENGFLPDLDVISRSIARSAKILFINYPNNPTSAIAEKKFFKKVVDFASDNGLIVCHDNAYSEMTYDGYKAPSFLETKGAMDVGIEFHSLSKTYNMTGWRLGFAVGNSDVLAGLGKVKTNIDSGVFRAVQAAGITALTGPQDCVTRMRATYQERRDFLLAGLQEMGISVEPPKATFYVWAPVPSGFTSLQFSNLLLDKAGVVVTPGIGFGEHGEGYIRLSLTTSMEKIKEAVERMRNLGI
ncbi:MAG: LL-diaminopimelate aminotransferase [Methanocellales archaeon]|nr:LL-diaminopimelate aminotransferase [Methanocellales archaeon]MDD5447030.1 LL-diaminopimelate aminotransferase [Methanocellales archaeon]